ncbi:tRNA (N6-isopentenyl adenosine(37)-C2)-methylthiotransferase MiaB [Patescibacteria group bacterium]|nr:tRNA (N6-isopentenyl adenosine(37)-C2)-methylthiotransferase MiaB [Patescibacteria group bacterium]
MPKYYTLALGCQMNKLDAEKLDALLQEMGFEPTHKENEADLINVFACSVRQSAINRIDGRLKKWNKIRKQRPLTTVLTGCVLPKDKKELGKQFDILLDAHQMHTLPKLLKKRIQDIEDIFPESDYFKLPTKHKSPFQAFVTIQEGCNKFCRYCAVPYTRGREISRPASQIVEEVKDLVKKGYKEITLLGQTVNSYQNPEKGNIKTFTDLIKTLAKIEGNFWIRFISPYPTDFSDELIHVIATEKKICPHLHIPVQAGSDDMLKKMLRKYTREEYLDLIRKIRKQLPNVSITTDIIVGFCDETEENFKDTLDLYEKVKFDMAYTAQYSKRPGTQATKLFKDNIPQSEKKRREVKLNDLVNKYSLVNNRKMLNKTVTVLVENTKKESLFGKTDTNKQILVKGGSKDLVGSFVSVKVTKALPWSLEGTLK